MKLNTRTRRINQLKKQVARLEKVLATRSNEVTIIAGDTTFRMDRARMQAAIGDMPCERGRFDLIVRPESATLKVTLT